MPIPLVAGFIASLWALIKISAPAVVFMLISALGIGFATYTGLDLLLSEFDSQIALLFGDFSATIAGVITLAGFDEAIKIIISAYTVRLTISGFINGSKTFISLRNPN